MSDTKSIVLEFLKKRDLKLCVLSTASGDAQPESAVMRYAVKDDLTVVLSTQKNTRKCNNIVQNPSVSLVFGWSFTELNLQCSGVATLIEEGNQYDEWGKFYLTVNPEAAQYKSPNTVYIVVKLSWIRLTDFSGHPPKIEEITLS